MKVARTNYTFLWNHGFDGKALVIQRLRESKHTIRWVLTKSKEIGDWRNGGDRGMCVHSTPHACLFGDNMLSIAAVIREKKDCQGNADQHFCWGKPEGWDGGFLNGMGRRSWTSRSFLPG